MRQVRDESSRECPAEQVLTGETGRAEDEEWMPEGGRVVVWLGKRGGEGLTVQPEVCKCGGWRVAVAANMGFGRDRSLNELQEEQLDSWRSFITDTNFTVHMYFLWYDDPCKIINHSSRPGRTTAGALIGPGGIRWVSRPPFPLPSGLRNFNIHALGVTLSLAKILPGSPSLAVNHDTWVHFGANSMGWGAFPHVAFLWQTRT